MIRPSAVRAFVRSVTFTALGVAALTGQQDPAKSFAALKAEGAARSSYLGRAPAPPQQLASEPALASFRADVEPILAASCYGCHGPEREKGDLRVDELDPDLFAGGDVETWLDVLSVLTNGEMPPPEEEDVHLGDDERRKVVDWLVAESHRASTVRRGNAKPASLRRLSRYEFSYVLQDLLALPLDVADDLPPDAPSHDGFENSSDVLQVTGVQFRAFYEAAHAALDLATVTGEQPTPLRWSVSMTALAAREWQKQDKELEDAREKNAEDPAKLEQALQDLQKRHRRRAGGLHFFDPITGRRAGQSWGYDGARFAQAPADAPFDAPVELPGLDPAAATVAVLPPRAALTIELGDRIPERGNLRVRVRAWRAAVEGHAEGDAAPSLSLHFGWQASNDSRADFAVGEELVVDGAAAAPRVYQWDVPIHTIYPRNAVRGVNKMGDLPSPSELIRVVNASRDAGDIVLDHVEVLAPVHDAWPPASHAAVFGADDAGADDATRAHAVLVRFLPRAWRRAVDAEEVERKVRLFARRRPDCDSFEQAMVQTLAAVLSSPESLYVGVPIADDGGAEGALSGPELATRLSLFLWCSAPDDALLAAGAAGELAAPAGLAAQVERLLADPRAQRFPREFVRQWLNLQLLDFLNVDRKRYPDFDDELRRSMREEPIAFFAELLRENLSVLEFLHADFAMLDERLAAHYGVAGMTGSGFRRVALAEGSRRGGLLTQAGLLAMNSDGKDSHPLKRGIWLLERLLDDPPPPPPAAVPVIDLADPEIARMTLKQRLENHRNQAACMSCHAKIDPWGIAFEHFDAVGGWRDAIGGQPVDAVAELFNKQQLDGADGLERFLLQHRQDQFVRALVKKLTVYALGRPLTFGDRAAVDEIAASARRDGDGLRSVVQHIVASELFHTR
ncbi:MAG: DUF1592 domain-containing protein [Planctomycetes bacterium]|nr:DUF1592 domain-containing protein [Planctomycetota bacterium]